MADLFAIEQEIQSIRSLVLDLNLKFEKHLSFCQNHSCATSALMERHDRVLFGDNGSTDRKGLIRIVDDIQSEIKVLNSIKAQIWVLHGILLSSAAMVLYDVFWR